MVIGHQKIAHRPANHSKMPQPSGRHKLTERNLLQHKKLMHEIASRPDNAAKWAELVIQQEQSYLIGALSTQPGSQHDILEDLDDHCLLVGRDPDHAEARDDLLLLTADSRTHFGQTLKSEKMAFLETPLERFLTPDGCSDPFDLAGPALESLGVPFGKPEGAAERKRIAQTHVEKAMRWKRIAAT